MVSAYFLSSNNSRRLSKVVFLIVQTCIFQEVILIIGNILNGEKTTMGQLFLKAFPARYFVILYCILYVISPYINKLLDNLSQLEFKRLVITSFILFSVFSYLVDIFEGRFGVYGLSPIGLDGSEAGYTIVNFVLLYLWGGVLAKIQHCDFEKKLALIAMGLILCISANSIIGLKIHMNLAAWNYNSPFIVMLAVVLLLIFEKMHFESRFINRMAKACFTSYLSHTFFFRFIGIEKAVKGSTLSLVAHQVISSVVIFAICFVIDIVWSIITRKVFEKIAPIIDRIKI